MSDNKEVPKAAPLGTNPKDLLGIKKVQLNLVPPASIAYQALAMENGAVKYGVANWRSNKVIASIYVAAALRHLYSWHDGEENASDSGLPHLAHALACLGILVDAKETGNLVDDRPKPGTMSKLIERLELEKKAQPSAILAPAASDEGKNKLATVLTAETESPPKAASKEFTVLEVGKAYLARNGEKVNITGWQGGEWCFVGNHSSSKFKATRSVWRPDGTCGLLKGLQDDLDLLEELADE